MQLIIDAQDVTELKMKLSEICASLNLPAYDVVATPAPTPAPRRARTKKAPDDVTAENPSPILAQESAPHAASAEVAQPAHGSDVRETSGLKETVFQTLKELSTQKGVAAARQVLEQFQCKRISELKEQDYPAFIEACKKAA